MTDDGAAGRALDRRVGLGVFLLLFALYFSHGSTVSHDSRFVVPTALAILKRGTVSLDAYPHLLTDPVWVRKVGDHYYSTYPIGNALVALPGVWLADALARRAITFRFGPGVMSFDIDDYVRRGGEPVGVELLVASAVVAATAALLYALARELAGRRAAFLAVAAFAVGTSAWSTASRGLWQHGPSMLALAATLLLLVRARARPGLAALAALPLAFSYVIRPTNAVAIVLVTAWVALEHRAQLARFLGLAALVAAPFFAFNLSVFHAPLSPYYQGSLVGLHAELPQALVGNWLAPSRGLLVYSPVLLFAFHGAVVRRRRGWTRLDTVAGLAILVHWITISLAQTWCGGNCFGPRYFTDALPWFLYFLVASLDDLLAWPKPRRTLGLLAFGALLAASTWIHHRGVGATEAVYRWNLEPIDINLDQARRAWDFHDIQFLRGL